MQHLKLLLCFLLVSLFCDAQLPQPKYKVFPSEYDCHVVNPLNNKFYSVLSSSIPIANIPTIIDGCGCLHHSAFIDINFNVWVMWDNATETPVKTSVTNAKQVQSYNNGTGNGVFIVTNDGKLQIIGSSQGGFRADGTEGNASETTPYTVTSLPKPVNKVVAGTYVFSLLKDSTVWAWGGSKMDDYHAQFSMGEGVSSPSRFKPTQIKLPEPIIDIEGGGDWTYAIGKSGTLYGTAYDIRFLGLTSGTGQLTWYNLGKGNLPNTPSKLSIGTEATYALMPNGDLYAWGNNTQAAVGNGQEGLAGKISPWGTTPAPWGVQSNSLWVITPYKVNPSGIVFNNVSTNIGDAFYTYAEDVNGNLWVWGRNKGYVLWNGQGGSSADQSASPNKWDVLSPSMITGFGKISTTPPPNKVPIAILSAPTSLTMPSDTIQLDASKSSDDGTIASYIITQVSGPFGMLIQSGNKATFYGSAAGTYIFSLVVVDNQGASSSIQTTVVINSFPICPPPIVCPPVRNVISIILHTVWGDLTIPASNFTATYDR